MAKFSSYALAQPPGKTVDFPLPGGGTAQIRIVPLVGQSDDLIAERARAFALEHGGEPKAGDPEYDRGIYLHTVLLACQDSDSPPDKPEPYFDGGLDQVLDARTGLDRERLALLFELQHMVQGEYGPAPGGLSATQLFDWLEKSAEADEGAELPFERSPRFMQRAFVRGIARLATGLLRTRSSGGPGSPAAAPSSGNIASNSTSGGAEGRGLN